MKDVSQFSCQKPKLFHSTQKQRGTREMISKPIHIFIASFACISLKIEFSDSFTQGVYTNSRINWIQGREKNSSFNTVLYNSRSDGNPRQFRKGGNRGNSEGQYQQRETQDVNSDDDKNSHFFSAKPLKTFIQKDPLFQKLCQAASIDRPSRIQSLAWPVLDDEENHAIIADQTGSGKTLAYLLPLLRSMLHYKESNKNSKKIHDKDMDYDNGKTAATPSILILTPTFELATQVRGVCASLTNNLPNSFRTVLLTSQTPIRDQVRMLTSIGKKSKDIDVIVSTPGRIASLLRSKAVDLSQLQSLVLDEVDVLLLDETFGPQLQTVGIRAPQKTQFVFVTATLPDFVVEKVKKEFGSSDNLKVIKGPGLHRVAPTVNEHLVDVSVPPSTSNRDRDACFTLKSQALLSALRQHRTTQTLVFCNTVESCRAVENMLKRKDRGGKIFQVGVYHNAMSSEARNRNLREFSSKKNNSISHILVCTDRAARGVDFEGTPVDHVVIFDFPKDPAEYVRRVGRTARAGRDGHCTVLAYGWQLPIARKIMGKEKVESDDGFVGEENWLEDEEVVRLKKYGNRGGSKKKAGAKELVKGNIEGGKMWKGKNDLDY